MFHPKIVNINKKDDFEINSKKLVRKNTKDIMLSGEWMK